MFCMEYFSVSHTFGPTDLFHPTPATHFKTFMYSYLLSEVFKSQHNTKLCSKYTSSNLLISSLDLTL